MSETPPNRPKMAEADECPKCHERSFKVLGRFAEGRGQWTEHRECAKCGSTAGPPNQTETLPRERDAIKTRAPHGTRPAPKILMLGRALPRAMKR